MCPADDKPYRLRVSHSKRRVFAQPLRGDKGKGRADHGGRVHTDAELVVEAPAHVLKGHQSIVNNVDWNRAEPMLVSAGVERHVRLWRPWPFSEAECGPTNVRTPCQPITEAQVRAPRPPTPHCPGVPLEGGGGRGYDPWTAPQDQ